MTEELSEGLEAKLDQLVRLMAVSITRGLPRSEQIVVLARAGLSVGEIAEVLQVTPNAVSVALYSARKKKQG